MGLIMLSGILFFISLHHSTSENEPTVGRGQDMLHTFYPISGRPFALSSGSVFRGAVASVDDEKLLHLET